MDRVERRMTELAVGHGPVLARHAGDTISAGGKRLRPLLVCIAAGAPPPETDGLVRAAVAVELVHGATLVHDDVLDGSALRRGRPTVVATGGRDLAIATGDLLFSRAFAELAGGGSADAVRVLSRASRELALGELAQRADAFNTAVTVARYLARCRLKTAVLFRAACELGALEGDSDPEVLGAFGERIGLAFQILDDVLDVSGPPERTGKPRGADLLDGTVNLPLILARARDPELAALDLRAVRTRRRRGRRVRADRRHRRARHAPGPAPASSWPTPSWSCRRCRRASEPLSSSRPTWSSSATPEGPPAAASMGPCEPVRSRTKSLRGGSGRRAAR